MRTFAIFAFLTVSAHAQTAPLVGDVQQGKELYAKYSCYACHGYDGHGGAGARLLPLAMTATRFTAYVHNPRPMPPYTDKGLSDARVADPLAFIKSPPASPSARPIPPLRPVMAAG